MPRDETRHTLDRKPVTARELARDLGVSQSTISRAYSRHASISPAMRARVLEAAKALGYQPNVIARSLTTRRSGIVGIVMATMTNPFYPEVLEQLAKALRQIGLQTLLFNVPPGQEVDSELPLLLRYQVDAVVIASATISSAMAREWTATGRHAILFNRTVPGAGVTTVSCDNVAGARALADYLIDQGHWRLAYVSGKPDTSTNVEREHGFEGRLAERGLHLHARADARDYTYDGGYRAARELAPRRPDAVFFANDIMALGGMDAFRHELGMRVPEDVSVVGFDDIPMAGWPSYQLTTVQQPVARMVEATVQFLLDHLEHPAAMPETHIIPGRLIERASARAGAPVNWRDAPLLPARLPACDGADMAGPAADHRTAALDDATLAYVTAMRLPFDLLRQAAAQIAGVLVLAAAAGRGAAGHPMLDLANAARLEANDAVLGTTPPARGAHHHHHLARAGSAIGAALDAARLHLRAADEAGLDAALRPLRAGYRELQ